MLDERGGVLYVGKAKKLKNRVRQYFRSGVKDDKTLALVSKIADFRFIITENEYEALILENNLIKENTPPYNILLKDDRTYPYIRIDVREKFPRFEVCYRLRSDGAKYFGPYTPGLSVRDITDIIRSVFPLRTCRRMPKKECLDYHLQRCLAPCTGKTSREEYGEEVDKAVKFLEGNNSEVEKILTEKMNYFALKEEFELAKYYRDILEKLKRLVIKQTLPFKQNLNIDVFTFTTNGMYSVVNRFAVRGGKFLGGDNYPYYEVESGGGLTSFIMQYYEKNPVLCGEIIVNEELEFGAELADCIGKKAGFEVRINRPSGGIRRKLVEMGEINGSEYLSGQMERFNRYLEMTSGAVKQLGEFLGLPAPRRMECYDVSHISGTDKVASMAVFVDGEKAPKHYRHFKIRTVSGNDDFACMYETLSRRLSKIGVSEDISFNARPDLIVIDGGKGQLASASKAGRDVGKENINIIALAKRLEEIFLPGKSESVILPRTSLALKLLIRIRDEAHRFALSYHKNLRGKRLFESELRRIPGIGKIKAAALLTRFKSIKNVSAAAETELSEVGALSKKDIENIRKYFGKKIGGKNEI